LLDGEWLLDRRRFIPFGGPQANHHSVEKHLHERSVETQLHCALLRDDKGEGNASKVSNCGTAALVIVEYFGACSC
jgi:hypothetical protein